MPASSSSAPGARPTLPRRDLRRDESAVNEIVGQIIAFGIVSVVFVLSMIAFAAAQQGTQDRVLQLQSDSAAARVAGMVVQAGLVYESQGPSAHVKLRVDLPSDLQGRSYEVALVPAAPAVPASLQLTVPSRVLTSTAPLFAVDAPTGLVLCGTTVHGGPVDVRYDDTPHPGAPCLYLESAA